MPEPTNADLRVDIAELKGSIETVNATTVAGFADVQRQINGYAENQKAHARDVASLQTEMSELRGSIRGIKWVGGVVSLILAAVEAVQALRGR